MTATTEVTPTGNAAADDVLFQKKDDGTWFVDFQPTDKDGNPRGNPFHSEGKTQRECFANFQKAYNAIVNAYHDVKTGQVKPDLSKAEQRRAPVNDKPRDWTAEESFQVANDLLNPTKVRQAIRKTVEDELGMSLDEVRENRKVVDQVNRKNHTDAFLIKHFADFFPTPQNREALLGYLKENNLAYTAANLDIAFDYLKDSLIQRPAEPAQQQSEVPADGTNTPNQPQRSATSGLLPGESSGQRPTPGRQPKGLTWEEIDSWSNEEWDKKKRDPRVIAQINALPPRSRR